MDTDHVAAAEYLEAIFEMAEEDIPTAQARVAAWMGVSAASVSEAVKRLTRDGLITVEGRRLHFTPRGAEIAATLVRRHRLAEHFLIRILGLPWHRAHEEAQRWERVISADVEERMVALLDDPGSCPHGNPIPGSSHPVDLSRTISLDRALPQSSFRLRRLTEDLELDLPVMRFLEDVGLVPGAVVLVVSVGPDGTRSLEVDGRATALGPSLADHLWVEPLDRTVGSVA